MEHVETCPALDKIFGELFLYQEPALCTVELPDIDTRSSQYKKIVKYHSHIFRIRAIVLKLGKYESYFEKLYVEDFDKGEILNYHVQSHLNDVAIFKDKMKCLLDVLKKDFREDEDAKELIDIIRNKVYEGLSQPLSIRDPHQHHGDIFHDGDALHSTNMTSYLSMARSDSKIGEEMRLRLKEAAYDKFTKDADDSFKTAQKKWTSNAQNVHEATIDFLQEIFDKGISPMIYSVCQIKPIDDIK